MADTNEHTGARLITKVPTDEYRDGWDRVFGTKEKPVSNPPVWVLGEDATQVSDMQPQSGGCCGEEC